MTAGEKLRQLRGKRSIKETANALSLTETSYIKYERNERVPRDQVKRDIAKFYNTTVSEIFFAN